MRCATLRGDRASTLLLFPAALLVVVVLAAITVDLARLHLAQRELEARAAAAANDLVTTALDEGALRRSGAYRLDARRADRALATALRPTPLLPGLRGDSRVRPGPAITVELSARVGLPFSSALPGTPGAVTARARAEARVHLR